MAGAYAEQISVEAVVLSGSACAEFHDEDSDFDIYVYSKDPIDVQFREALLRSRAIRLELHRTFWEDEDAWIESTKI